MFENRRGGPIPPRPSPGPYDRPMPVSAHDVAAELRARQPGMPVKKLHKLLYYCQGHHLAVHGEPLFDDTIEAWDMGPVVAGLWRAERHGTPTPEPAGLDEAALNTVGYTLSRYGALTEKDLENLTHGEDPWRNADKARQRGDSPRIEHEWIAHYFQDNVAEENRLDRTQLSAWLRRTAARPAESGVALTREQLIAEFAKIEARLGA